MAKPPAKPGKAAPVDAEAVAKPKSKRILLIVIGILILGAAGGAIWYFAKNSSHTEAPRHTVEPPKFIALEPFTVNLQSEEGEKFLQTGITLKIANFTPDLEEKMKIRMPEIRSRLLLLLSSKRSSDLVSVDGKKRLAQEIYVTTSAVLGLRAAAARPVAPNPRPVAHEGDTATTAASGTAASGEGEAVPAPVETAPVAAYGNDNDPRIMEVLFTSFIIQ